MRDATDMAEESSLITAPRTMAVHLVENELKDLWQTFWNVDLRPRTVTLQDLGLSAKCGIESLVEIPIFTKATNEDDVLDRRC
jgi:hypothetical protein